MSEISPCPMPDCGGECYCKADGLDDKMQECPPYWIRCKNCHYLYGRITRLAAINAHNALCADTEKGRRYDELEKQYKKRGQLLTTALSDNATKDKRIEELECAVRQVLNFEFPKTTTLSTADRFVLQEALDD